MNFTEDASVTKSLRMLERGDNDAAHELWEHFFTRLVSFARSRVNRQHCASSDEEDIALSAFKSVCIGIREGKFPNLNDRDGLWCLMLTIASRKAADKFAFDQRAKRSANRTCVLTDSAQIAGWLQVEPNAETEVEFADLLSKLMSMLEQPNLKQVAILRLEGHTNRDIAKRIGKSLATVERKLRTIREIWESVL